MLPIIPKLQRSAYEQNEYMVLFSIPGPNSTDNGFPVRRTGSPIVTPAFQVVKNYHAHTCTIINHLLLLYVYTQCNYNTPHAYSTKILVEILNLVISVKIAKVKLQPHIIKGKE